jgi:hypothetical protein
MPPLRASPTFARFSTLGILRLNLVSRLKNAGIRPVLAPPDTIIEIYRIADLPPDHRPPQN